MDLSLLEPLHMTLGPDAAVHRITSRAPLRPGNRVSLTAPRNVYATIDGAWIALSASTQGMADRLFRSLSRPELIHDPRFRTNADRFKHAEELDAIIQDFVGQHTLDDNLTFFRTANATVEPVYDTADLSDTELGSMPTHAVCLRLSDTPGVPPRPAPDPGQHEVEILTHVPDETAGEPDPTLQTLACNSATGDPCKGEQHE